MRRALIMLVAVGGLLSLIGGLVGAQSKKPDATVELSKGSVAAGIGFSWGNGTLDVSGQEVPGQGREALGRRGGDHPGHREGNVFELKKLEDFSGNYTAAGVGATVGGGAGAMIMKNQNGVVIELTSTTQGASLKLAASGIRLTLEK